MTLLTENIVVHGSACDCDACKGSIHDFIYAVDDKGAFTVVFTPYSGEVMFLTDQHGRRFVLLRV